MISYVIFPNEGGIACKKYIPSTKESTYLVTKEEFNNMVEEFTSKKYRVKKGTSSIHLYGSKSKITIRNYEKILDHPLLQSLRENIERRVSLDGFSTVQSKSPEHLNTKPNREKSNRNAGSMITKATKYVVVAILVLNVITGNIDTARGDGLFKDVPLTPPASAVLTGPTQVSSISEERIHYNSPSEEYLTDVIDKIIETADATLEQSKIPELDEVEELTPEIDTGYIDFEDLSETDKAINTKTSYYDIMCECAKAYGLDENLILGIATQERGTHSSVIDDGGGLGLMQIQYEVWINEVLDYYEYNPETGEYEYHKMTVTDEIMRNLESNIHTGARILQKCLRTANYNIPVAIQMYNQGSGAIKRIITTYANDHGKTYEEVLSDPEDLGWMDYRHMKAGDPKYIENVIKWIDENTFEIVNVNDLSVVKYAFENTMEESEEKVMN